MLGSMPMQENGQCKVSCIYMNLVLFHFSVLNLSDGLFEFITTLPLFCLTVHKLGIYFYLMDRK